MRFSRKVWETVKSENPDFKLFEVGRVISQMWQELSEDQKKEYVIEFENEKVTFKQFFSHFIFSIVLKLLSLKVKSFEPLFCFKNRLQNS